MKYHRDFKWLEANYFNKGNLYVKDANYMYTVLHNIYLLPNQFAYVVDYPTRLTIARNTGKIVGIDDTKFTYDNAVEVIQIRDTFDVQRYMTNAVVYEKEKPFDPLSGCLCLNYRTWNNRHVKRDTYILEKDAAGYMVKSLSICTDISQWNLNENHTPFILTNNLKISVKTNPLYRVKFTDKEQRILEYLKRGLTSRSIALDLGISKHTVDVHRRHLLDKTSCNNTVQLIDWFRENVG